VADRLSGYVFVLVWLVWRTLFFFLSLFFFCKHGCLSTDCLSISVIGDVGVGGRGGRLLPVRVGSRFTTGLRSRVFGCKSNRPKTSII